MRGRLGKRRSAWDCHSTRGLEIWPQSLLAIHCYFGQSPAVCGAFVFGPHRCAAPLQLSYATNGNGKTSPRVLISFIDLLSVRNETRDARRESGGAFRAVPNMKRVSIAPILRPFGGDLLTTALNAFYAEARTTIGMCRRHDNLPLLPST